MAMAGRVALLLFAIYLLTYGGGPHAVDEIAQLSVARSIVLRGAADTNELYWTIPAAGNPADAQSAVGPSGDVWSKKGIVPSLLMVPWVWLGRDMAFAGLLAMAPVTALTGGLLVLLGRSLALSAAGSAGVALIYGLATLAWPYSRLNFGEPAIALAIVVAALVGRVGLLGATGAGLAIAFAAGAKPSALALALPVGMYVALGRRPPGALGVRLAPGAAAPAAPVATRPLAVALALHRRRAVVFAAALALGLAPQALYNAARFGSPFSTGYALGAGEDFATAPWVGLAGLLLSPYRGVLWFVPLVAACLLLGPLAWRRSPALMALAVGTAVTTLATYAAWWTWWGGYTWGPRFLLPALPLLVLAVPLAWPALGPGVRVGVGAATVLSVAAQLPGVLVDFNPFERALRERWPTFPAGPELWSLAASPLLDHTRRLAAGELDVTWAGKPALTTALVGAVAASALALVLSHELARREGLAAGRSGAHGQSTVIPSTVGDLRRPLRILSFVDRRQRRALADFTAVGSTVAALILLLARGPTAPTGAAADLLAAAGARPTAGVTDATLLLASPEVPALWSHDRWRGATYGFNRDDLPSRADAEQLLMPSTRAPRSPLAARQQRARSGPRQPDRAVARARSVRRRRALLWRCPPAPFPLRLRRVPAQSRRRLAGHLRRRYRAGSRLAAGSDSLGELAAARAVDVAWKPPSWPERVHPPVRSGPSRRPARCASHSHGPLPTQGDRRADRQPAQPRGRPLPAGRPPPPGQDSRRPGLARGPCPPRRDHIHRVAARREGGS